MKVIVSGAGPSGLVAAASAISCGHSVRVFEEHARSGSPQHCSGLISKEGLESLSDLADYRKHVINEIRGATFDFAGERFEIERKQETAFVIDRAGFDAELAEKAESMGASFIYNRRFSPESGCAGCGAIIGADGPLSGVASYFNFPKIRSFAFTLKAKARISADSCQKVSLFYDNSKFPGFFAWLIPHNESEAEIGLGTTNSESLRPGFDYLIKKLEIRKWEKPKGRIIPISPRSRTAGEFGGRNVLLVGDAAGQVKSSSGGGVVFGTSAARLAGKFVFEPKKYESQWRREIGADMGAHSMLRSFFAAQPGFSLRLMSASSKLLGLNWFFSLYGNMDRPTHMLGAFLERNKLTPAHKNAVTN